ncbi:MAG TPA: low temperature requirement protein A [Acidimicrobiia bacterium]|jgi:low temperature requirement protein LtrA|nr:low temperature requirement protein A [Acidimicrobiia bacterium]
MRLTGLRPPRLRTAETEAEEHRVTWLELFYDLVFVVAVAQLGHRLLVDHSVQGTLGYIGLFIPLWYAWAQFTFYADRYDTNDLGQRLLAIAQMVAIALMAASISGDEADSMTAFAVAYVLARAVLLVMYVRAYRHVQPTRALVRGYLRGFSLGGLIWLISIWVPSPARFVLWGIGMVVDFATPWLVRKEQAKVPLDVDHLPERFGLFTILVLGEPIAAIVAGLAHEGWRLEPAIGAMIGVMAASALWWLYFENAHGKVVRRRSDQVKAWRPTVWIFSHLPLAIALTAAGIGMEFLVANEPEAGRWIVGGGVATAMVALGLILIATDRGDDERDRKQAIVRFVAAGVVLLVALVSAGWSTNVVLAVVTVILGLQIAVDLLIVGELTE